MMSTPFLLSSEMLRSPSASMILSRSGPVTDGGSTAFVPVHTVPLTPSSLTTTTVERNDSNIIIDHFDPRCSNTPNNVTGLNDTGNHKSATLTFDKACSRLLMKLGKRSMESVGDVFDATVDVKRRRQRKPEMLNAANDDDDDEVSVVDGQPLATESQPNETVERRNLRERKRVRTINNTFSTLFDRLPSYLWHQPTCGRYTSSTTSSIDHGRRHRSKSARGRKKPSKVDTLRTAIEYIRVLQQLLTDNDDVSEVDANRRHGNASLPLNGSSVSSLINSNGCDSLNSNCVSPSSSTSDGDSDTGNSLVSTACGLPTSGTERDRNVWTITKPPSNEHFTGSLSDCVDSLTMTSHPCTKSESREDIDHLISWLMFDNIKN